MYDYADLLEDYLIHCSAEKRLSSKTVKAYRCDLKQFFQWLRNTKANFDRQAVTDYLRELNSQYSPASAKRKIASIRAFAYYQEMQGTLESQPFYGLRIQIKEPQRLPRTISKDHMNALFKVVYEPNKNSSTLYSRFKQTRDQAIFEVLIATGLRVSELCSLNYCDIDLSEKTLCIMGKGSKERVAHIVNKNTLNSLETYFKVAEAYLIHTQVISPNNDFTTPVFINRFGKRISEQSVRDMIVHYSKLANVTERITPHMFRHTFATLLLEKDVDIRYIQKLLGHSSITTTEIYAHASSSKLRNILEESNPRDLVVY